MALIIHCEGPCGKQMGSLEQFKVHNNKYMCLHCAGVQKPRTIVEGTTTGRIYQSKLERFMLTLWPLNEQTNAGNIREFNRYSKVKFADIKDPAKSTYWMIYDCGINRDDTINGYTHKLEPITFDLIAYNGKGQYLIATVIGHKEEGKKTPQLYYIDTELAKQLRSQLP